MLADKILNFIDGEFVATDKWFDNRTPISNAVIGQVAEAGKAEVDAAVGAETHGAAEDSGPGQSGLPGFEDQGFVKRAMFCAIVPSNNSTSWGR